MFALPTLARPTRRGFVTGATAALLGSAMPLRAHVVGNQSSNDPFAIGPAGFDPEYVEKALLPFVRTTIYAAPVLTLPMIETTFSKQAAIPPHFWGVLYRDWQPALADTGTSVFITGLENRGADNHRKRIYMSATTPDLYLSHYRPKVRSFFEGLFDPEHAGTPLMEHYFGSYFDMYWDLHLGVRDENLPQEVRDIGSNFTDIIGFWDPRTETVYQAYMRVRQLRPGLTEWVDQRIQDVIDRRIDDPEATFVHYWVTNGELGPDFRREDVVFECFHNFLAFSQWALMTYRLMEAFLDENSEQRRWLRQTMAGNPDAVEEGGFTPLDRLVMELFRTISPNGGSLSTIGTRTDGPSGAEFVIHSHPASSRDPRHWTDPDAFNPERYRSVETAADIDQDRCAAMGLARCPFAEAPFQVKDDRPVVLPSSGYGTVHALIDGTPAALADSAGYAPFGFGYRRCAGEWFTVEAFKDFLRLVHDQNIVFDRMDIADPVLRAAGPVTTIEDNIAFQRA